MLYLIGTPHVFPLSNLKRIPRSTDKQRNTEPFTWKIKKGAKNRYLSQQIARNQNQVEASGQQSRDQQCIN